ncbi:MAG TPA: YsnF/AvaK domain-containing protein [Burkholderiaceae bacterium]|nr:YsnF/AvaK domain-containing protein [Burkholderiaceae bacterium]
MRTDRNKDLQAEGAEPTDADREGERASVAMPVIEERLDIARRVVQSGAVRLRKVVHEEVVTVDEPGASQVTEVERIPMDRPVDTEVAVRHEGDTVIFPVVEERLVTRKQLVLVAEIRVTRCTRPRSEPQQVTLRREEVIAERLDPESGEWRVIEGGSSTP